MKMRLKSGSSEVVDLYARCDAGCEIDKERRIVLCSGGISIISVEVGFLGPSESESARSCVRRRMSKRKGVLKGRGISVY